MKDSHHIYYQMPLLRESEFQAMVKGMMKDSHHIYFQMPLLRESEFPLPRASPVQAALDIINQGGLDIITWLVKRRNWLSGHFFFVIVSLFLKIPKKQDDFIFENL